ncbi:MAG: DEAD/DEAH box helicase [Treponema sp.]|jgi:superfamily II DNA or RNA helicase|nr:DEAD/DEAH box helicase [Treponema sp.]
MEMEIHKRGRPQKVATVSPFETKSSSDESTAGEKAVNQRDKESFYFTTGRTGGRSFIRFCPPKSGRQAPDFRRFTGPVRELLREFIARKNERSFSYINLDEVEEDDYTLYNPEERFIEQALAAGILRNEENKILLMAEGEYRCAVHIENLPNTNTITEKYIDVSLELQNESRETAAGGRRFYTISPRLAVSETTVYRIRDLGLRWAETDRIYSRLQKSDLPAFLSLVFSGFSNLELLYEGWSVKKIRPAAALPALLFMEIDKYGYLHVRPISFLRSFPPHFLENEEIISVVEIFENEKIFGIAEVIFPEPPEDQFRSILGRGAKGTIKNFVHEENGRFIIAPKFAQDFFAENIIDLSQRFVLLEAEVLTGFKLSFSRPKIRLSIGKGIDYLSGKAVVEIEGERFSFSRFMAEYRRASCITLADGTRSFPDKRTMERLDRLVTQIKGNDDVVELSYFDIPLLLQDDIIEIEGTAWEEARPFFVKYNSIQNRPGNWSLENGQLRPYQEYGIRWLDYLREYRMGACLADEMGLGKTIQVIALLRSLYKASVKGNCLIICPRTLVFNWAAEMDRFAPELPYRVHIGERRDKTRLETDGFRIIISTYMTVCHDIEELQKINFLYIILDESQYIKSQNTQTTAAVLSLNGEHRLALSGTPIENNLGELYSLFRFLNPSFFGTEKLFLQRYLRPIQENKDEDVLKDLKARIYPFMLRRLKRDVLKELPAKTEETAYIELEESHLAVYHRRRQEYKQLIDNIIAKGEASKSQFFIFKALGELRRLATVPEAEGEYTGPSAKRQYLLERITELAENNHKCLIFTNFLAIVDIVSEDLAKAGIQNLTMTGSTVDRQSLVKRFQTDNDVKAFILTLKTGGAGINLTAADYIFIMDPWWNNAVENQAIDRSHRIGQQNPVFCYRLIAKDTIEERILELQKRKTNLAAALLTDDLGAFKTLSPDDVAFLVGDAL